MPIYVLLGHIELASEEERQREGGIERVSECNDHIQYEWRRAPIPTLFSSSLCLSFSITRIHGSRKYVRSGKV